MQKKREERLGRIPEILKDKNEMSVKELAGLLKVTPETLRKDLDELEKHGQLIRSHGTVRIVHNTAEIPVEIRKTSHHIEKQKAAYRAIAEIENGMTVYLDSGSTLLAGAEMLRSKKDLTIVVNSIPIATEVLQMGFRVLFLGGAIDEKAWRTEGYFAEEMVEHIHLDLAILGTSGLQKGGGFGVYQDSELGLRKKIMEKADKVIVVMDRSKLHEPAVFQYCQYDEVDCVVTNQLNDEERTMLHEVKQIIETD